MPVSGVVGIEGHDFFDLSGEFLPGPSGTESGLIRHYNEVVCDKNHPDPWLLADFARPFINYFGVKEYYDGDDYLGQFNEKSLTEVIKEKYGLRKT